MLNKDNYSQYKSINSIIHNIYSPIKLISIILLMICIIFIKSTLDLLILLIYLSIIILLSKVKLKYYLKNILQLKTLIIFIIIINLLFKLDFLQILYLILKIILIITISSILMFTTKEKDITYGLEKILTPLKKILPIKEMALSITMSLQFIPTILQQSNKVIKAQASRGIDFYHTSIIKKIESIMIMFVPIFVLSLKKADNITDIMNIRLYGYYEEKTNYQIKDITILDIVLLLINVIIIIIIILL